MALGATIAGWLVGLATQHRDAVGQWLLETIANSITKSLEDQEPGAIEGYQAGLQKLVDDPNVPEDLKAFFRKSLSTGNPISAIGGMLVMALQSFGVLLGGSVPLSNILRYVQDKELQTFRFDPASVISAWRRNPALGTPFFEDLREQGWTEERLNILRMITEFLPTPQDLISWQAREVFEPEIRARYGLDEGAGTLQRDLFYKLGFTDEQIDNYWAAHWEHPAFNQVVEMIRRGHLTESRGVADPPTTPAAWDARDAEGLQQLYNWYGLVEIVPYWRELLSALVWETPTRVDVRRWWEMRTINEDELRGIYHRLGYHGEDLENYIRWTKVYTEFPSLLARWSKGWLTLDEVRQELLALGIPAERVEVFLQEKVKPESTERVTSDRDLTVTDIFKGVKQERITRDQGIELLQELGYDEDEATFKMDVNVPVDETDSQVQERELTKSDVRAGLKAGLLSEAEALARLRELRYSAVDSQLLLDIFKASITPPEEDQGRQESKADIISAVKKGLITQEEGYLRLIDIGFTDEASLFILQVQTESSPFSPVSYSEFKDLAGKFRKATGRGGAEMPEELKQAADELVKIKDQVNLLTERVRVERSKLVDPETASDEAKALLVEAQVALNRALAEQQRLQQAYNTEVAIWRQQREEG